MSGTKAKEPRILIDKDVITSYEEAVIEEPVKEEYEETVNIVKEPYSKQKEYHMLPNSIYRAMTILGLTANEKLVYLYLVRLAHNSGNPFPSYADIMKHTGIRTENTLAKCLNGLEKQYLIKRISRGNSSGRANTYKVFYIKYNKIPKKAVESL